ncbi:MAG: nucleotidyltransferase domain-containing protein [Solirubrobacteraceae bacterium]
MFRPEDRKRLRAELISTAQADAGVSGAALLGSSALGREDRWSDIDLALCFAADADQAATIDDWTDLMYGEHTAVHHFDVTWGAALYRVYLLSSTLQVDLSFWPPSHFRAVGPSFSLIFGQAANAVPVAAPVAEELIGAGWLHALHGRSSIARGRVWQAEYMISAARDRVLALACLRHGLPTREGRGMDYLPKDLTVTLARGLIGSLDAQALEPALRAITEALLIETEHADPELARRLAEPLSQIGG